MISNGKEITLRAINLPLPHKNSTRSFVCLSSHTRKVCKHHHTNDDDVTKVNKFFLHLKSWFCFMNLPCHLQITLNRILQGVNVSLTPMWNCLELIPGSVPEEKSSTEFLKMYLLPQKMLFEPIESMINYKW